MQPGSEPDFGHRAEFYTFTPDALDEALAEFEVLREVGRGSMGIVFEARRRADGERVAVKLLPPSLTLTERALARFLREAELMRKVEHAGIARVLDLGRSGRLSWFVMEFVDGQNLERRLEVGPLPVRDAASLTAEVAAALHFAHERGIVHRDIKPGNLIVRDDRSVVITDFGLARETGTGSMTESGAIVGTPMYMAPEQVLGERTAVGARSDVYGLGATLYTLLAGRPPFEGPTAQSVLKQVLDAPPIRLRRRRAEVPPALEAIVHKAMERHPELRYGSCAELRDDLQAFLSGQRVGARMPGPVQRAWRYTSERPVPTTLAVATIALAIGAYALLQEGRTRELQSELTEAERLVAEAAGGRDERGSTLSPDDRRSRLFDAVARCSRLISRAPDFARAWFVRAKAHHLLDEHRDAIADLDMAERVYGAPMPQVLLYRIDAASRLSDRPSRSRLRDDLFSLLDLDPGPQSRCIVAGHLLDMAGALSDTERLELLQSVSRILAPVQGESPHQLVLQARIAELQDDPDRALDTIRRAIDRWPGDLVVQTEAAQMFRRLGLEAEGRLAAERARIIDPSFGSHTPEAKPADIDVDAMEGFLENLDALIRSIDR